MASFLDTDTDGQDGLDDKRRPLCRRDNRRGVEGVEDLVTPVVCAALCRRLRHNSDRRCQPRRGDVERCAERGVDLAAVEADGPAYNRGPESGEEGWRD